MSTVIDIDRANAVRARLERLYVEAAAHRQYIRDTRQKLQALDDEIDTVHQDLHRLCFPPRPTENAL